MKKIWNRFTAWLSGWPEAKAKKRRRREVDYLFAEQEMKLKQEERK